MRLWYYVLQYATRFNSHTVMVLGLLLAAHLL
jgi:hypothetical protein